MAKVLIADDHAITRVGYRQFLEAESGIGEVGEASSGNEVIDKLQREEWDLVLLDLNMPDRSGLDILKRITAQYPSVSILVMSGLPEEQYALNVLRSGAKGYLSKGSDPEEVLRAIRLVLSRRRYVSAALAEQMAANLETARTPDQPLHALLSAREFQIFCKLAGGQTVAQIGAELT